LKNLGEEVERSSIRKKQLEEELEKLKGERKAVFMNFFEKMKGTLKQCYEKLTELQPGVAGKADLYLENSEIPFDNGVYFTPTPPNKRYIYDLEQLSGG
jgi:chromosome segregation ATPase